MQQNLETQLKNGSYRIFSKDTPKEQAVSKFKNLFGFEPEICEEHKGLIWVGPIRKDKS
jgi:hypothetical protein